MRSTAWGIMSSDVVLKAEGLVLGPRGAPVEQVDVEALADEVLDEAVAGDEVEDVGLADQRVDHQQRHGMTVGVVAR